MSASDHLGPQFKLYHGTDADLAPGDVIAPPSSKLTSGEPDKWVAWATRSLEMAHHFGAIKAYKNSGTWEHHVYEVEPQGNITTKFPDSDEPFFGAENGLKVVRKVVESP